MRRGKVFKKWKRALSIFMAGVTVFTSLSLDSLVVHAEGEEPDPGTKPNPIEYVAGDYNVGSVSDAIGKASNYGIVADSAYFAGHLEANFAVKSLDIKEGINANGPKTNGFVGNSIVADLQVSKFQYEPNNDNYGPGYIYTTTEDKDGFFFNGNTKLSTNTDYTKAQLEAAVDGIKESAKSKSDTMWNEDKQNTYDGSGEINLSGCEGGTYYFKFADNQIDGVQLKVTLNDNQKIVLNIPDTDITLAQMIVNGNGVNAADAWADQHIIYNCPKATNVTISGQVDGILIMPNADVKHKAVSGGWIIAGSYSNKGDYEGSSVEWHLNTPLQPFTPDFPTPDNPPTPDVPETEKTDIMLTKSSDKGVEATGAEFTLYKDENCTVVVDTVETKLGALSFTGVEYDTKEGAVYYIKETKALNNHLDNTTVYKVTIATDGTYSVTDSQGNSVSNIVNYYAYDKTAVEFVKKDSATDEAIVGVEFTIYSDAKEKIASVKSDANGVVSFTELDYSKVSGATYYIKETSTPVGYEADDSELTVVVEANGRYTITGGTSKLVGTTYVVTNTQLAPGKVSINFTKVGTDNTSVGLEGAVFALYSDEKCQNSLNKTATSASNGSVTFPELSYSKKDGATYYIKETTAPDGYVLSTAAIKVSINKEGGFELTGNSVVKVSDDTYLVTNNRPEPGKTQIVFTKVDSITENPIKGAEFQITYGNVAGTKVVSGDDGKVVFEVSYSTYQTTTYTIKETKAPEGYDPSDAPITVTIDKEGNITFGGNAATLTTGTVVKNVPKTSTVKLSKQALNDNKQYAELSGASMELYVAADSTGSLEIAKRVSGPAIKTSTVDGKKVITWTSDGQNALELSGLTDGTYVLKETAAPTGYKVATEITFVVKDGKASLVSADASLVEAKDNVVVMIDDAIPVTEVVISKQKLAVAGEEISGANLELKPATDGLAFDTDLVARVQGPTNIQISATSITWMSSDTPLVLKGLKDGSYTLTEKSAPKGYEVATAITFTVADGVITVENFESGLTEIKDGKNFVIMKDAAVPVTTVKISKEALKVGGPEIPGAKLELTPASGNDAKFDLVKVTNYTSKTDSKIEWTSSETPFVIEGLRDGSYTLHEVAAPTGYAVATDITFTVKNGEITVENFESGLAEIKDGENFVIMVDDAKTTTVEFSKQALNDKKEYQELPGATIQLYPATLEGATNTASVEKAEKVSGSDISVSGGVVTWVSGEEPTKISGLTDGTYVMKETIAPKGYTVVTEITFEIKDGVASEVICTSGEVNSDTNYIVMFDAAVPVANVTLSKEALNLPEGGRELPGASMKLSSTEDKAFELVPEDNKYTISEDMKDITWTSTKEPLTLTGIKDGTYVMSEVAAPNGYEVATSIEFTVKDGIVDSVKNVTATSVSGSFEKRENNMVVMIDDAIPATVTISKQDLNVAGKELPGASLTLTADSSNAKNFDASTVTGGSEVKKTSDQITWISSSTPLVIDNIPDGKYVMHEVAAPDGYSVATDISFEMKNGVAYVTGTTEKLLDDNDDNFVVMKDRAIPTTSVSFSKQSMVEGKGGEELPGATIYVFPYNVVGNNASVDKAKAECDDKDVKVTIEKNVTLKYDANTQKDVPVAVKWVSGTAPVKLNNLPDGTYVMHEEVAPAGFLVATDIIFKVTNGVASVSEVNESVNGIVTSTGGNKVIMMDKPRQPMIPIKPATPVTTLEISKRALDVAGEEIDGAQLTLSVDSSVKDNTGDLKNAYAKSGATITKDGGVVSWTSTTESLVLLGIPDGQYILHEEVAPDGYVVATDIVFVVKDRVVTPVNCSSDLVYNKDNKNVIIMVDDVVVVPKADVTLSKRALDAAGDEIEGASIVLTEKDGKEVFTEVTTAGGGKDVEVNAASITWTSTTTPLEVKGLEDGVYVMHEVAAPDGYSVATDITFKIEDGKLVGVLDVNAELVMDSENANIADSMIIMVDTAAPEEKPITTTVSFSKKGLEVAGDEIEGAEITVTAVEGTASFKDAVVDKKSGGKDVTVTDGSIKWISTDKPVVISNVPDGTYLMHEDSAPNGYTVATDIKFVITDGVATPVDCSSELVYNEGDKNFVIMVDDAITSTVSFSKKALDVAGDEIPGASIVVTPVSTDVKPFKKEDIKISDKSGGENLVITDKEITWISTDKPVVLSGLPDGTYKMHEEAAPNGYVLATDIVFTISNGEASADIKDVTSGLVKSENGENFVIMVDKAVPTTSVVFSKKALNIAGDEIANARIYVYADNNTKDNSASIDDAKATDAGRIIEVVKYTLEDKTEVDAIAWTSTKEALEISGLPDGTYIMHEDAAPSGFLVATDIKFTIKDGVVSANADDMTSGLVEAKEGVNYVIMVDDAITTTVSFSKEELDVAGVELEGAELSVYPDSTYADNTATIKLANRESGPEMIKSDEKEIITWTSGTAPLVLSGLTEGRYVMHEVAAPDGYAVATDITFDIIDGKAVAVSLKSGAVESEPNLVLMIDSAIPTTSVTFSKKAMNVNGEEIEGALIYVLVDPTVAGNSASIKYATSVGSQSVEKKNAEVTNITDGIEIPVIAWTSGKTPVVLAGLPDGQYIMHEEAAPSGYLVATDIRFIIEDGVAIPVDSNSTVVVSEPNNMVTMVDDATTKVMFDKVQRGNVDVSVVGAELSITSADGSIELTNVYVSNGTINKSQNNTVITWTSEGVALEFWGLPNGDYILSEINAPKDYKVTDPILFNANNGVITYIGDIREDGSVISSENGNSILMADLYDPVPKNPKKPPSNPPSNPEKPSTPPTPPQTPEEPPVTPVTPEEPTTPPTPTTVTPPTPVNPTVPVVNTPPKKKPGNKATVTINDNKTPMASDVSKAGDVNTDNLTGDEFAHDGFLYAILSAIAAVSLVGAALLAKKKEDQLS